MTPNAETETRVRAGIERLRELGVPEEALAPLERWAAKQWADRVMDLLIEPSHNGSLEAPDA